MAGAEAGVGSRSAGSHMSRSLLILRQADGWWLSGRPSPTPCHSGPPHPRSPSASPPVVEALIDLLAGQEDVGAGQDHFQAAAGQGQRPALEGPHLFRISRNHHLRGGAGKASERRILTSYHSFFLFKHF